MKRIFGLLLTITFLTVVSSCNKQDEPDNGTQTHQPKNPSTFSLAGKTYVGDIETLEAWTDGWYRVFKFSSDSIWQYETPNSDLSPQEDQYYLSRTTYTFAYPNISVNQYPHPLVISMQDTLTISLSSGTCLLR